MDKTFIARHEGFDVVEFVYIEKRFEQMISVICENLQVYRNKMISLKWESVKKILEQMKGAPYLEERLGSVSL